MQSYEPHNQNSVNLSSTAWLLNFNLFFQCNTHTHKAEHEVHGTNSLTLKAGKTYNEIFSLSTRSSF